LPVRGKKMSTVCICSRAAHLLRGFMLPGSIFKHGIPRVTSKAPLWLLVALIWPVVVSAQQDSMKACNLLTATELSTALGGSVGHPMGIFTPKNAKQGRNGDFWSCEETVGTRKVWIFYNTLQVTEEGKKLAQEQEDRFRKEGYQIQKKELNGSRCATRIPPGTAKGNGLAPQTSCEREKGPYQVIVAVEMTGANDLISMERVASLVEKATTRIPTK
jgi:hypothetical protein